MVHNRGATLCENAKDGLPAALRLYSLVFDELRVSLVEQLFDFKGGVQRLPDFVYALIDPGPIKAEVRL
jgi:hypothetical protein